MRFYLCVLFYTCCLTTSFSVLSSESWWQEILSPLSYSQLKSNIENKGVWYRCEVALSDADRHSEAFCLDDFSYYQQHLYGEAVLGEQNAQFSFLIEYHRQHWNDLVLNLRKDGFVLRKLTIAGEQLDVVEALKSQSSEAVDREVIMLMNRYPQDAFRILEWTPANEFMSSSPRLHVSLHSDGDMIQLNVIRF
ncbi:hypothetical protein VIMY103929_19870 [Vibrio mytili]|uniref:Uncharacterized protein n=1 Tax=Vibrio mytili TaxID=50718 RepID=A0A0C3IE98_9VIBR|nr:hypothetical protein SU60_00335 [Vibrio mytili]